MTFRYLVLGICLGLSVGVFAENHHQHPQATPQEQQDNATNGKVASWAGYCEIEIINNSYEDVSVYGIFDDGSTVGPFNIYSFEAPHYISLYYYGYCHSGMDLYIDSWSGYHLYAGYTPRRTTIRVIPPYLTKQARVDVRTQ